MSNLKIFNQTITDEKTQNYLQSVLGEKRSSFVSNMASLVSNKKELQDCEPLGLIYAGIKATALDLPLDSNLGFAYVIPYDNKKEGIKEAQFQLGWRGLLQLAIRSGQFKTINVREVREGEIVGEDFLSGEIQFKKLPNEQRELAKIIGYVSFFRLMNGMEKMLYMSVEDMEKHAKRYSQTYKSRYDNVRLASKWSTDFDAMSKKTVLKLLLSRYAPLSIEMVSAIKSDQAVLTENGEKYVDNEKLEEAEVLDAEVIDQKEPIAQKPQKLQL